MYKSTTKLSNVIQNLFKLKILDKLTTGKINKNQLGKTYGINPTTINGMD